MALRNVILFVVVLLFSCEKDDICLEGTPGTASLVVLFKDHQDPMAKKAVDQLLIRGFEKKDTLSIFSGDSLAIPLRNNFEFTQYEFTLHTASPTLLSDSIQFNHTQYDTYINRSCGYRSTFVLENPFYYILTKGNNGWIKSIEKIRDTLIDEKSSHLAIYH